MEIKDSQKIHNSESSMSIGKAANDTVEPPVENWHALDADHILQQLVTPLEQGLSNAEAARRLEAYGPNQLDEAAGITFLQMLLDQFNNFVVIMLIAASIISA